MTSRPLALFQEKSVSMDWNTGTLLSHVRLRRPPNDAIVEDLRLRHALDHLRLRGWRYTREWGSSIIAAPYPVTLPQLYRATMEAVGQDVACEDEAQEDAAWRLEIIRELQRGLEHLWVTYQCLMTYMSHQPGRRSLYAQNIIAVDPFRRWFQVYRYEADDKCMFSTSLRNISKSIPVATSVEKQWYGADDFLQEQYYRCVQDVGKLQRIHDQIVRDSA